ncbi:MAG TPA: hypothetical protein VL126_06105 [Bacteroidota bacterium]|nr:hypothetical protein [Bacteroidota bacterium]
MISPLRRAFNERWTGGQYRELLSQLDARCGAHVSFRVSETPVFIPSPLLRLMEKSGREIMLQLVGNPRYMSASERTLPRRFHSRQEPAHPLFAAVDFGIVRDEQGELSPRLIELQGFPTLFAYQVELSQLYQSVYALQDGLTPFALGFDAASYWRLFRSAVLGDCPPEHVVLLEIDPLTQKTLPDFLLTEKACGIATVNVRDVVRKEKHLFYRRQNGGTLCPIDRIYNRVIPEDLERSGVVFDLHEDVDVQWAGHPSWFFRMSKFSLPFIDHPTVPKTMFLSDVGAVPDDLQKWVLKPLFSFAGGGVKVGPAPSDLKAIAAKHRADYVLQERVDYASVVETPEGPTKAEIRIMYIWQDEPTAVLNLVRMGRGAMMGVDHNKNMAWVGSSAGFWPLDTGQSTEPHNP